VVIDGTLDAHNTPCPPTRPCERVQVGNVIAVPSADPSVCLVTAERVQLMGQLTIDLSNFSGDRFCLFQGSAEGTFDSIAVLGASCVRAVTVTPGQVEFIFEGNTCAAARLAAL